MKPILQAEAAECGLACLAMIGSAYGLHVDMTDLRRRFSVSLKGVTLSTIIRHAEALNLAPRPLRLELEELKDLRVPCILHWNLNHFVVLKEVRGRQIIIFDPAVGKVKLSLIQASKSFTGVALELTPNANFKPADQRKSLQLRDLTGPVVGLRRTLMQVFLLAGALEVFALAAPLFNQFIVDEVVPTADKELLTVLAIGFSLLLLTQTAVDLARSWVLMRLSLDVRMQWTGSLFAHLLKLPPSYFEKRHLGDLVSRFGSINAMQSTLTTAVVSAILDGIMGLLALVMMLLYSLKLAAIAISATLLYGALRWIFYAPFRDASKERLVLSARENSHFLETLRAIVPIKLARFESERRAKWQNLLADVFNRDVKTQKLEALFTVSSTAIGGASGLLLFTWGTHQVMENTITLGMLMAFSSYASNFMGRCNALIGYGINIKLLEMHAERVSDIALEPPEDAPVLETDTARLDARIEVRNLGFRYADGEPWILKDLNLMVEAGESVAIVGPSGCGKTTLLKLILGLLTPTEGEILIGGVPVKRLGMHSYRTLVGAVLQDDALLAGSIAENISFFDSHISQARLHACADIAAMHEEISQMPMGYQTLVGDMGTSLSGGQRQRIFLARALYRMPKVLILDEATSHLDANNEQRIVSAMAAMKLTRIAVAHRRETIERADRVIALTEVRSKRMEVDHQPSAALQIIPG